jgi:class 3 adenylate cyclase
MQRRSLGGLLLDRSIPALLTEIERTLTSVEPLASYLPAPILNLLVETAARRRIPPEFPEPTIMFVNLLGLSEAFERAQPEEHATIVATFSRAMALINAAVETRGGVLRKITYHLAGSDMMIYFGVPNAHTNDVERAASAALAIREALQNLAPPQVGGEALPLTCQIGLAQGPVFAAEIGEPRGRREFNILSDTVNTAARLMSKAAKGQVLISEAVYQHAQRRFECAPLGALALKGKAAPVPIYALARAHEA